MQNFVIIFKKFEILVSIRIAYFKSFLQVRKCLKIFLYIFKVYVQISSE